MNAPYRDSTTTSQQLVIDWDALINPSNGGATIETYNLQWDSGTSGFLWSDLSGISPLSTALTYTRTTGVSAGSIYNFKVRAKNIHGWGPFSPVGTIKAASSPAQMSAVTTSIDTSTGGVKISWTAPFDNNDAIIGYKIEIFERTGTTATEHASCNGLDATVISNKYCIVPISVLTTTYGYLFDELVMV